MKKYVSTFSILLILLAALSGCGFGFEAEKEPRTTLDVSKWPTSVPPTVSPEPTPFPKSTLPPATQPASAGVAQPEQPGAPTGGLAGLDLQKLLSGDLSGLPPGVDLQQLLGQLTPEQMAQLSAGQIPPELLAQLGAEQTSASDVSALLDSLNVDDTSSADVSSLMADLGADQITSGATTNLLNQASSLGGLSPVAVLKTSAAETTIRQGPGDSYGVTEVVAQGELAAVLGTDSSRNWLFIITIKNTRGWIPQSDARILGTLDEAPVLPPNPLTLIAQKAAAAISGANSGASAPAPVADLDKLNPVATARVSSEVLNMRQRPGPDYPLLDTLPANTEVAVLGLNRDREWALVANAEGKTGWVSLDFLDVTGSLANAPIFRTLEPATGSQLAPVVETSGAAVAAAQPAPSAPPAAAQPAASAIPGDKSFAPAATARVTERVNMLTGPGPEFGALAESTVDQNVTVLAVNAARDWAFVRNPLSKYGWVPLSALSITDGSLNNARPVTTGLITSDNLTLSNGPGIFYEAVGPAARNEFVAVLGLNPGRNWALVETVGGGRGYIPLRLIKISEAVDNLPEVKVDAVAQSQPAGPTVPAPSGPPSGTLVLQTSSGGKIMAINADGSDLSQVTASGIDPVLSPDGRQVAFTRWQGDVGSLWVANTDGSGERAVVGEMRKAKGPDWSPDGRQIVLNFQQGGQVDDENMCVPLGSKIPFDRARNIRVNNGKNGPRLCFILLADPHWTLRVVNLSDGKFEDHYGGQYAFRPAWDPAQPWRVISAAGNGLLATDVNNPDYRQQLTDVIGDGSPVMSPDGRFIAVVTDNNGTRDIYRLNADGSGRVRLTQTPLWETVTPDKEPRQWNNVAPAWSPDGSRLAFLTDRTGRWEVWVMNADGANQQPLFSNEINGQLALQYNFVDERAISWR